LTLGLPGYPPTWTFLRNSVVSDMIFTLIFVVGVEWAARRFPQNLRPRLARMPFRPAR